MNPDMMCSYESYGFMYTYESTQDRQIEYAKEISKRRGKKGKERKNWQNNNTIWQGKRRFI